MSRPDALAHVYGMESTCPVQTKSGLVSWLACMRASIVVLKRWAIRNKVSPSTTTYVRGAPDGAGAAGEETVDVMGAATVGVTDVEAAVAGVLTGVGLSGIKIPELPKISASKQDGVSQSGCQYVTRYFFNRTSV